MITRYDSSLCVQIGRYACHNGITAASRFISGKLKHDVSKSTILSTRDAYMEAVKENRAMEDTGDIESLPVKKRGRRVLLGIIWMPKNKHTREGEGVVSAMAAAREIVLTCDRSMYVEFGGHVHLSRHRAYSLLHRIKFVQRKVTTAKSKHAVAEFEKLKKQFLDDVVATVEWKKFHWSLSSTGTRLVLRSCLALPGQCISKVPSVWSCLESKING